MTENRAVMNEELNAEVVRDGARLVALVPCAGSGSRASGALPKQYVQVAGQALVMHTVRALQDVEEIARILVVLSPGDAHWEDLPWGSGPSRGAVDVARVGGQTRAQSVLNGLNALLRQGHDEQDWVLVHDAARCLIRPQAVRRLIQACRQDRVGGLLALPLADTLKQAQVPTASGLEASADAPRSGMSVAREGKWLAQTPQMFRLGVLHRALERALGSRDASDAAGGRALAVTDEASAVEAMGLQPLLVPGDWRNFKVTWPEDFAMAEQLLAHGHSVASAAAPGVSTLGSPAQAPTGPTWPLMRIGEGWDIHALVQGRPLILGGVEIAHAKGLQGHSDADALLHAITDAVLGAAGMGDIGRHFPDTDEQFAGTDSWQLLRQTAQRVAAQGWRVSNLDATIVAQAPKMAPHIPAMCVRIAQALEVDASCVNVKAKTAEKFDAVGRQEAIEARAVCMLTRAPSA